MHGRPTQSAARSPDGMFAAPAANSTSKTTDQSLASLSIIRDIKRNSSARY